MRGSRLSRQPARTLGGDAYLLAKGLATRVPGIYRIVPRKGTGGSDTAYYCYSAWMKHLTLLHAHGLPSVPARVAELGPGDSLGVGLAALLCGASRYWALDVVRYSDTERSLRILDELVALLRQRAAPLVKGWPEFDEHLDARQFPAGVLSESALDELLRDERVAAVRAAIAAPGKPANGIAVNYAVPWTDGSVIQSGEADLIFSHSVLEHVAELGPTYAAMARWLRPGGWMTHQIDFTAHGLCQPWNGHRSYGERMWAMIVGGRPFLINREPPSTHLNLMRREGFEIACAWTQLQPDGIERARLAPRWQDLSDEDLHTVSSFIQARKPDLPAK
jgi:Methyltransferase domain